MCDHVLSVSLMGLSGNLHVYFFNEVMQQELNLLRKYMSNNIYGRDM